MDALKICVNANGKNRIFYTDLVSNYKSFLDKCEDEFMNVELLYKYWQDQDGDKIEINGDRAFQMFLKLSPNKKIFITISNEDNNSPIREKSSTKKHDNHKKNDSHKKDKGLQQNIPNVQKKFEKAKESVHRGVACDACDMKPIIGYRYKCLECDDYDLCMSCEGKSMHSHHKMMRIPQPIRHNRGSLGGCNGLTDQFNDFAVNIDVTPQFNENRRRHNRHHRRHTADNDRNVLHNIFKILRNSVDEQNSSPTSEENNNNQDEKKENINIEKEKKTENSKTNHANASPLSIFPPELLKAGEEILKNFGHVFGNYGVYTDVKEGTPNVNQSHVSTGVATDEKTTATKTTNTVEREIVLIEDDPDQTEVHFQGAVGSDFAKLLEESLKSNQIEKENNSDDIDWTLINKSQDDNSVSVEQVSVGAIPKVTSDSNESKSSTEQSSVSYADLSKLLETHINDEHKVKMPDAVYHKKAHINNAIIAMMAMGFSNDGQWLTHLLETVDGDISQALDLLKPVK